jgi:3-dehydrosphinganine reductase
METNYYSSAYIAHAFLQPWLQNPSGTKSKEAKHIVFTSSIAAFLPIVGYSLYSPSKVALRALADTLSQELLLYHPLCNIRTHTIFPGTIFSPGLEIENQTKPAITKKIEESDGGQTCEEVAAVSVKGLERGEELITTSGIVGVALKAGMLGTSRRNGLGIVDTVVGWIAMVLLVVVRRDLDGTVRKWGRERLGKEK